MSDPQYDNIHLIMFFDGRKSHFRKLRFDTKDERDNARVERFARDWGIIEKLEEAGIQWQVCLPRFHRSALMCLADRPEHLPVLNSLIETDIGVMSLQRRMDWKKKSRDQFVVRREMEELERLPQDIANLQAQIPAMQRRLKELEDKYTTRVWLRKG